MLNSKIASFLQQAETEKMVVTTGTGHHDHIPILIDASKYSFKEIEKGFFIGPNLKSDKTGGSVKLNNKAIWFKLPNGNLAYGSIVWNDTEANAVIEKLKKSIKDQPKVIQQAMEAKKMKQ
jgi:hypothetical protein